MLPIFLRGAAPRVPRTYPSSSPFLQNYCRMMSSSTQNNYEVGFIGLGAMGYPMAAQINKAFPTAVWNRTSKKAQQHADENGTTFVESVEDFKCPVIFCCLPTSKEVDDIAKQLPKECKLFVDCTSGNWEDTMKIGEYLASKGINMVDCPISGGVRGAEGCTLTGMYGGHKEDVELAMKYSLFCKVKHRLGPLGAGHATKAVNNILNTANLMLATEGLLALKNCGVSPEAALSVINKSSGRSLQSEVRIPEEVLDRRFGYGFKLNLMHKDVATANAFIKAQFPNAQALPVVADVMDDVLEHYKDTPEVDYTRICSYLEHKAGNELRRDGDETGKADKGRSTPKATAASSSKSAEC